MLGVGFVGAGMATQAMHLPALATVADRFRVVHVMDTDLGVARSVAAGVDARASATLRELLDDPAVDVVAVCSPDRFHAEQVAAACRAGKQAVLCEKPLAVSREEGRLIRAASVEREVPVVVGTMHAYDPGFLAGLQGWHDTGDTARVVRSVIYLPSVGDQVDWSTEHVSSGYVSFAPAAAPFSPAAAAMLMRTTVLDLAIHNLPLVRALLPAGPAVRFARVLQPFGYVLSLSYGDRLVQLLALMWGRWRPRWTFDVWGKANALHVDFPPSYVLAGSATAELTSPAGRRVWRFPRNGYQAEWEHLHAVVAGEADPVPVERSVADLDHALDIADAAEALVSAVAQ